jgi:cytochrome c556
MKHPYVKAGIVVASLTALVLADRATAQTAKMTPAETVAERQRLMKLNGASWADAQAKLKAGNAEAVAVNAETMAFLSREITSLFPEGSMTTDSKAKPEIWQKWAEFESAAKNFQAQAEKLRDAAKSKDAAATEAVAKDFGRQACGTCHTPFRVPPPRS